MPHSTYTERDYRFGLSILALRTASNLTQSALARRLGVSRQSIAGWEAGTNYPSSKHLLRLIELCLQYHVFHPGQEAEEIRALWENTDQKVPLDETWLANLLKQPTETSPPGSASVTGAQVDWGDAPEVAGFCGRESELALLTDWLLNQRCRVLSILGMGGIGKTSLAARLTQEVSPSFERVYWRSLRDALPPDGWLAGAISFLSDHQIVPPSADSDRLTTLLQLLRARRCLLVMDNFETLFEHGQAEGRYRAGLAGYGRLLRALGESNHQSCLVVTSRETPPELAIFSSPLVRAFPLGGLGIDEAQTMLAPKQLSGSPQQWDELTRRFGGNGLALKMVSERIRELFGGEIGPYLDEAGDSSLFGGIRKLLAEQAARASEPELWIARTLAIAREPLRLADLLAILGPRLGRETVLESLESLNRRSLVERVEAGSSAAFTLQSVVLEYVTDRLVEYVTERIAGGRLVLLVEQPLIQAQARDYVRQSQERLIGMPILARLKAHGGQEGAEQRLLALLDGWRGRPVEEQGYGPGNIVNLLRLLRGDLRGLDLSRLAIRQAYLAEVDAQDASLADSQLAEIVLAEGFSLPLALSLSGNGSTLALATATGDVWLWRTTDRTLLLAIPSSGVGISCVALSGDGRLLASGGSDGMVRLWDAATGQLLDSLRSPNGSSKVHSLALSADGRWAATGGGGGEDGTVWRQEAGSWRPQSSLRGHTHAVWAVVLSADGRLVASSSQDGVVRLWEAGTGRPLATLQGHTGAVHGVALSADGQLLVSGGTDGTVQLWEASTGRLLATLQGHTSGVRSMALSADGRLLASGGEDGTVRLWEAGSEKYPVRSLRSLQGHTGGVRSMALSADGQLLASGGKDGTVRLWEAGRVQPLATLQGQTGAIWEVALSADGNLLVSGGADGTVRLWEAGSGRLLATLRGHTGEVRSVAVSTDGHLLASAGFDGTVCLWDGGTGKLLTTWSGGFGAGVELSPDGQLVANYGYSHIEGAVRVWEAFTGQSVANVQGHDGDAWSVVISADNRMLVSGGADGTVRLWELPGGRPLAALEAHPGGVSMVALSTDGQLLAATSPDGTVRLWELPSGRPLPALSGHTQPVLSVALSADGQLLASGCADGTVLLWEPRTGKPLATLRGHNSEVWGVALSADGRLVASGGWDGTVRLWDTRGGALLRTLRPDRRYERLDITGLKGITDAQRGALLALGAVENEASASAEQMTQR